MDERPWRDLIVGDRMRVDQEFASAVSNSGFSRSEWGMIMTAVEFEVEGEGDSARLVADTSRIDDIMPEVEKVVDRMGPGPDDRGGGPLSEFLDGGLVDSVRASLGLQPSVDQDRLDEAVRLVDQYAGTLQRQLEDSGKWDQVRELAAEQDR